MPARSDLIPICQELATRAGIKTFYRQWFEPWELDFTDAQYPAMGFRYDEEGMTAGSLGFNIHGIINLDVWIWTGQQGNKAIANHPEALTPLDELHDTLLDHLSDSYPELHAQTISLFPDPTAAWRPFWWYVESPHAGATLRLIYEMGYAPKSH